MDNYNIEKKKEFDFSQFLLCEICYLEYNTNENKPYLLNCGHTLCKYCLISILDTNYYSKRKCPFDKTELSSTNISSYNINYEILDLIKKYGELKEDKEKNENELYNIIIITDEGNYNGNYKKVNSTYIKEGYGTMNYNDGNLYKGNFKNDKREGKGILTYTNGDIYDGEWENDLQNGEGIYIFKTGKIKSYEGNWRNGHYFGFGKIKFSNGNEIESIFLNNCEGIDIIKIKNTEGNIFLGHINKEDKSIIENGYQVSKNGNISIGNFIYDEDKLDYIRNGDNFEIFYNNGNKIYVPIMMDVEIGKGKIIYKNGNIYIGDILEGKKEGKGIIKYKNGSEFKGEFKNDKKNGKGNYINGKYSYEGDWVDNKKEGSGIEIYENGESYCGDFKNNKKNGKGNYINGKYSYDGDWVDNKKEGSGIEIYENGESYCGDFKNDKKNGNGVYVFQNKSTYKGEWKDDKMNGKGIFIDSDGIETEGIFENGNLIEEKNNSTCFIF